MRKQIYPYRLIPKAHTPFYNLKQRRGNYNVVRLASGKVKIKSKEDLDRHFKASMASKEFIDGVSVSLVSGYRKQDRVYAPNYSIHPDWELEWNGKTTTERPVSDVSMRYKSYFGFRIKDFNDIEFEYIPQKNVDDPEMQPITLTLRVEHKPSNINYWHCNIYICEKGTLRDTRKFLDATVIKRMAKQIVPLIQQKALLPKKIKQKRITKLRTDVVL